MTAQPHLHLVEQVLRPSRGTNVFESTVEQLVTAIRLGVFVDGDQLPPERELAERLGVARNTLREAIAALRDAGLVRTRRGRGGGTVVTYHGPAVAPEDGPAPRVGTALVDALDFRRVVEPGAARLAALQPLAGEQRAWLVAAARQVRDAEGDSAHRLADSRFHLALASASGSPMLIEAVTRAQAALGELLEAIPVLRTNIQHSHDQHDAVLDAVLAGAADEARAAMEEHCDATSALLRGFIG
ncbi:FadR family transcriptional regulator [Phycicoccus endophyticus]|uniref:FadR family transcriptional regulator n=1 Tax=Phycicoccus endophyticus TaxID=1690220 RepID=A0A7G9QYD9_9MICO|nr:FCD domain-containing protein [Phycicoccus endophyticus]NHI19259.1 FadR family transcriptional regulator [Phycicoccus endophyticus]QNN48364.1 FadR family transcriptional regulator [Phycicoccus endophyticus]GGL41354.1 GntR family transcriptional regulator [Phycicoccus endophyticus]